MTWKLAWGPVIGFESSEIIILLQSKIEIVINFGLYFSV